MEYLCRHPEEVQQWVNKEKRFDQLTWLRKKLPRPDARRQFYNTANNLTHANLRPIDAFSTLRIDDSGIRYLIVGPNPYPIEGSNPINLASTFISYPIRVMYHSDRSVMDDTWVTSFHRFDAEAKFPFGEEWE